MAHLDRVNANVVPFSTNSTGTNRTVFGGVTQSDDIDDNYNSDFRLGWEIASVNDAPTKQDFNALGYTSSYLAAYLYQSGIAEWNANQDYFVNSQAKSPANGFTYISKTGTPPTANPGTTDPSLDSTNWRLAFLDTANTVAFTPTDDYHPTTKKTVDIKEQATTIVIASDADYTLDATENTFGRIVITDPSTLLTTGRNIIVSDDERYILVENNSLQTETVKTSAGTGIAVEAGAKVWLLCDGTDVIEAVESASTSGILQVVSTDKTDTFSTSSTDDTFSQITGLTASITPSSTSSKVRVTVSIGKVGTSDGTGAVNFRLRRDSTDIALGDAASNRVRCSFSYAVEDSNTYGGGVSFSYIDSPSSTSAITYGVSMSGQRESATTSYINRAGEDVDTTDAPNSRTVSTITVEEIGA